MIAWQLSDAGVIKSSWAFKTYAIISGSAHALKPGKYILNSASSTPVIIGQLVNGPKMEEVVVIQEGLSLRDISYRLSSAEILSSGVLEKISIEKLKGKYEFLKSEKSLEGFLFPDTYRFFIGVEPEIAVKKFLNNFEQKAWPLLENQKRTAGKLVLGPEQILIIASIIEKEIPDQNNEDREIAAGIMYKRLKIGMALQVDATLVYNKCSGLYLNCKDLTLSRKDLSLKSPYNTYLNKGLPPTPICNPGIDAIEAALNPKESEFLYYLSDPVTKKTIFSKTLDEHNQNSVKYLNTK